MTRDPTSKLPTVKHVPNASSGGQISYTDIGTFLRDGANGPEHQALLKLIGTLLDRVRGKLEEERSGRPLIFFAPRFVVV